MVGRQGGGEVWGGAASDECGLEKRQYGDLDGGEWWMPGGDIGVGGVGVVVAVVVVVKRASPF